MTVEGLEAIAAPLHAAPSKLTRRAVGAATWRAFDALDRVLAAGLLEPNEIRKRCEYRIARLGFANFDRMEAGRQLLRLGHVETIRRTSRDG